MFHSTHRLDCALRWNNLSPKVAKAYRMKQGLQEKKPVLHISKLNAAVENCMFFSKSAIELQCVIGKKSPKIKLSLDAL